MWGEQFLEAFMTNIGVRAVEVLAAPAWIWWKSRKVKRDWPMPILIGFSIVVLASCLFLEEKLTAWVQNLTYSEERVIRDWLDELKYPHTYSTSKDDAFRFTVVGQTVFDIFQRHGGKGILIIEQEIKVKPDVVARIDK